MKTILCFFISIAVLTISGGSGVRADSLNSRCLRVNENPVKSQFLATSNLLDASINSLNSLNSLIKKENYRNKITAFNNPTTNEMGFSLETEIQNALKPLLDKCKTTNTSKFAAVVNTLVSSPSKTQLGKTAFATPSIFGSLMSLVGNLTVTEKKVTRQDLDSFMLTMSKYFIQYEKLNEANRTFDQNIEKFTFKLQELQFDIREYMLDVITILYQPINRSQMKTKSLEELFLLFLDKDMVEAKLRVDTVKVIYPADGIKSSKEIVYGIQKLFTEYQKIYTQNYSEIRTILLQAKELGKNINTKQVDASVLELQQLYTESKDADVLNLRLNTLNERLKILVASEQLK